MKDYLKFETDIAALESQIEELKGISDQSSINILEEVARLERKLAESLASTYSALTPWQKVQVARHALRPHFGDYVAHLFTDYLPLSGDRLYGDDKAITGGFARIQHHSVVVLGMDRGHDTESRLHHNFGMARPEGYRKAQRLMQLADRFGLPLITFVDTPGAYPGIGAEERGQAEAIARCIGLSLNLQVPIISVVIGEGGSGGAIALATADRVLMLEHAIYSVISPEGCASILWRDATKAETAAAALSLTAQDLMKHGIIDEILGEPVGGAHRNPNAIMADTQRALLAALDAQADTSPTLRRKQRTERYTKMTDISATTGIS